MTRASQAVVALLLGSMLIGLSASAHYLDFVRPWTRIPLLISGALLLGTSWREALGRRPSAGRAPATQDAETPSPRVAWLLLAPILVVFVAHPSELGAYTAERQGDQLPPRTAIHHPRTSTGVATQLGIFQFVETAAYDDGTFLSTPMALTGFVSYGAGQDWYVSRLSITCCAADALASRVQVLGATRPPRNTWITVTGTWVDPHQPVPRKARAQIQATQVLRIAKPKDPYEY